MMTGQKRFLIVRPDELPGNEIVAAKSYWASAGVKRFYQQPETHWSAFMAEQILQCEPRSVLEFGCNVGRNLVSLRDRSPALRLHGVDVNGEAVAAGRAERDLDLAQGDESYLWRQAENGFDVVFTVSVLDHVPQPRPILEQMVRIARRAVLLLEPSLDEKGKILKNANIRTGEMIDTTPYSYSWDYQELAAGLPVEFTKISYPLEGTNLGPFYWLFKLVKK